MTNPVSIARLNDLLAGRYRIERELGAGGMATVYLAHDDRHDRSVALKVLKPELAAVIGADRFLNEIKTTANLQHPHILALHDSGEMDGTVWYVMPLVEGESLRDRLERETQLPIDDAITIAREVAGALDYAHRHGVIHRDIKPENILLHDGRAVVADFGIALAMSRTEGGTRLTETGMSLGTPYYMSPEQALGEKSVDGRTDVYALGAVLYEMLVGEPPFTGPSAQAIIAKVMNAPAAPIAAQRPTVPAAIDAAVMRALSKLPADRFKSAADFSAALQAGAGGPPTSTHATMGEPLMKIQAARGAARLVPWAVAAGALAIAAMFAMRNRNGSSDTRVTAAVIPLEIRTPTDVPLNEVGVPVSISPDGTFIVFVGPDPEVRGPTALWKRSLDRLDAVPIPGTRGANAPVVAADGKSVFFLVRAAGAASNRARVISIEGGVATDPFGTSFPQRPARDGRVYARGVDSTMHVVTRDTPLPANQRVADARVALDVSPDGKVIATASAGSHRDSILIGAVNAKFSYVATGMSPHFLDDRTLAYWAPDGTLMAGRLDASRTRFTGAPLALIPGVAQAHSEHGIFDVAADGTLIYEAGGAAGLSRLVWVKPNAGRVAGARRRSSRVCGCRART